jgi:hypothetical protein
MVASDSTSQHLVVMQSPTTTTQGIISVKSSFVYNVYRTLKLLMQQKKAMLSLPFHDLI